MQLSVLFSLLAAMVFAEDVVIDQAQKPIGVIVGNPKDMPLSEELYNPNPIDKRHLENWGR